MGIAGLRRDRDFEQVERQDVLPGGKRNGVFDDVGEFRAGDEWIRPEGDWRIKPIVKRELWERAQAQLDRNAKFTPKGSSGRLPKHHVFVRGMLRCGICGEAMLPRSRAGAEWYACRTHVETGGAHACPMPIVTRADVDRPALRLFERWVLDVEGTRQGITDQFEQRAAFAHQEAERAATEAAKARAALAKADRDYEDGELGPVGYERQLAKQTEAIAAAEAEYERLSKHAEEIAASGAEVDADAELIGRLAALRAGIADRIGTAAQRDVDALRAALTAVFSATYVIPHDRLFAAEHGSHDELHALIGEPCDDDDAALVLERGPDGRWREHASERLALVPVVRDGATDRVRERGVPESDQANGAFLRAEQ